MGATTGIEWTDASFSPWFGCTKVHAGCKNCYSDADNHRFKRNGSGRFGPGQPRVPRSEAAWLAVERWAMAAAAEGRRLRVFPSLCDVLDEEAPPETQRAFWQLIRDTAAVYPDGTPVPTRLWPELARGGTLTAGGIDWQLLTKRPERSGLVPEDVRPLVWLGTSVSDQETADVWVPRLLTATGFRLRFLSAEPLLGPVKLFDFSEGVIRGAGVVLSGGRSGGDPSNPPEYYDNSYPGIDWVIIGGESGPGARPMDLRWARDLKAQCAAAGVPCFLKQLGAKPQAVTLDLDHPRGPEVLDPVRLRHKKGGDWSEWPADLRVREFPDATEAPAALPTPP